MAALLTLGQARQNREAGKALEVEAAERLWRRSWKRAHLECVGFMLAGYLLFGYSWSLAGDAGVLASALGFAVAYVLPFLRLIVFFVRHSDQF